MKYNNSYRKLISKTTDNKAFSQWRQRYLDGMTAQEWVTMALLMNHPTAKTGDEIEAIMSRNRRDSKACFRLDGKNPPGPGAS